MTEATELTGDERPSGMLNEARPLNLGRRRKAVRKEQVVALASAGLRVCSRRRSEVQRPVPPAVPFRGCRGLGIVNPTRADGVLLAAGSRGSGACFG